MASSIGPLNLMIRADSTMVGQDMDTAMAKMKLKGSMARINPALDLFGAGISKGLGKGLMRELPGILGEGAFGKFGGVMGTVASVMGPVGLAINAAKFAGHMVRKVDPELMEGLDKEFDEIGKELGETFKPMAKGMAESMKRDRAMAEYVKQEEAKGYSEGVAARYARLHPELGMPEDAKKFLKDLPDKEPAKFKMMSMDDYADQLSVAAMEAHGGEGGTTMADMSWNKDLIAGIQQAYSEALRKQALVDRTMDS